MTDSGNKIRDIFARFKDLTAIGFANIIANGISGLFWLYIARVLGTENYGHVSYYIAISGIAVVMSFLGAGTTIMVYSAKGVKIEPPIYFMTLISSSIASVVLFFIFYNAGVSLFVLGNVIFGLVVADFVGHRIYKSYAKYLIMQKIVASALAIGLNSIMGPNGVILGIALSFFMAAPKIYQGFKGGKIDFSLIRSKIVFIMNNYVLDISRSFNTSVDKIIVAPLLGFAALGNYQLGIQVLTVMILVPSMVFQYTLPRDAKGIPSKKLKRLTILTSVVLAILGITLAPIVLPVLFPKFTSAITVIQIISLSIIPATINTTYISKLLGNEKSRIVLIGSGIFFAVEIPGMILLGKYFGINGVTLAWDLASIAETVYLITVNRLVEKQNKIT